MEGRLPEGVRVLALATHEDARGGFTEIYREAWPTGLRTLQWNAVRSRARVLRGVHVHVRHADYLTVVAGRATVGLRDLRRGSPTEGLAATVELAGDAMRALAIPVGVAHGFYFHEPSVHVYAVTRYFDPADEFGCHFADPALGIAWPCDDPVLSARDADAGPLSALLEALEAHQPIGGAGPS